MQFACDGDVLRQLGNQWTSMQERLRTLEAENHELRAAEGGGGAPLVRYAAAEHEPLEPTDKTPEIVIGAVRYAYPSPPQQHARAAWRNNQLLKYLDGIGCASGPVPTQLVTGWFKKHWFGDERRGVTRLTDAGFAAEELPQLTTHHVVADALGGSNSIYNYHLMLAGPNAHFGSLFTKEMVAFVGEDNAHVARRFAQFARKQTEDALSSAKFDPYAVACPRRPVLKRRAPVVSAEPPSVNKAARTGVTLEVQIVQVVAPRVDDVRIEELAPAAGVFPSRLPSPDHDTGKTRNVRGSSFASAPPIDNNMNASIASTPVTTEASVPADVEMPHIPAPTTSIVPIAAPTTAIKHVADAVTKGPVPTLETLKEFLVRRVRPCDDCQRCVVARGPDASVRSAYGKMSECGNGRARDVGRMRACVLANHAVTETELEELVASHQREGALLNMTDRKRSVRSFMAQQFGIEAPLGTAPDHRVQLYALNKECCYVKHDGGENHGHTKRPYMGFEVVQQNGAAP